MKKKKKKDRRIEIEEEGEEVVVEGDDPRGLGSGSRRRNALSKIQICVGMTVLFGLAVLLFSYRAVSRGDLRRRSPRSIIASPQTIPRATPVLSETEESRKVKERSNLGRIRDAALKRMGRRYRDFDDDTENIHVRHAPISEEMQAAYNAYDDSVEHRLPPLMKSLPEEVRFAR